MKTTCIVNKFAMLNHSSTYSALVTRNCFSTNQFSVPTSGPIQFRCRKSRDGRKDSPISIDPNLTQPDQLVLQYLLSDAARHDPSSCTKIEQEKLDDTKRAEVELVQKLEALNDENSQHFEPTVTCTWDMEDLPAHPAFLQTLLHLYIQWASHIVRRPTDVVFVTHLILYFVTSVPSAIHLFFYSFTWIHGIFHAVMTGYYFGTYTLMRHNHIHNNGILSSKWWIFDSLFPYLLDPLMGHTWNSYYYHHVKHHHVEANGPGDLSSTIRLQRDEITSLLYYVSRFVLFVWIDLPLYFVQRGKRGHAFRTFFWEFSSYMFMLFATKFSPKASTFVFLVPFSLIRLGLMIGNFGQHAFVDEMEPDSDYRSSITLIDVPVSFNPCLHGRLPSSS
jgi:hypothetical protein